MTKSQRITGIKIFALIAFALGLWWYDPHAFIGIQFGFVGTTAALVAAGLSAAGAIGGSAIGASAAKNAANTQVQAAQQIGADAKTAAATATNDVNTATDTANAGIASGVEGANQGLTDAQAKQLEALKPYIDAGQLSLADVQQMLGVGGALGPDAKQFSFTPQDYQNDPQYAFIRDQANQALERSAASRGGLFTGGTAKAAGRLNTNLTNTFLDSAFNRAKSTYDVNHQAALQRLNALQGITNLGYSATGLQNTDIGNTAQSINANNIASTFTRAGNTIEAGRYAGNAGLTAAQIAANALAGGANAKAAGDIGVANSINSGIGGIVNAGNQYAFLSSLFGNPTGGQKVGYSFDSSGNYSPVSTLPPLPPVSNTP